MNVAVIDGQGGRLGRMLVEGIIAAGIDCRITAVGTNSIATAAMLKAGAQAGATGENPVLVASRDADVIIGPLGLLVADSLLGEITPAMAQAVGRSQAVKLLLPVNMFKFDEDIFLDDMTAEELSAALETELRITEPDPAALISAIFDRDEA